MWNVTIKGLLAHKLRMTLTAIAIVLGVTFVSGTFILTDTLHQTFTTLLSNVYQNVDFQVRGVAQFSSGGNAVRNPIAESVLPAVQRVPGVEAAAGTVGGYAQFVSRLVAHQLRGFPSTRTSASQSFTSWPARHLRQPAMS
jgi:putative ABC transport system permease protein